MFGLGEHFQPSLMFVVKASSYLIVEHLEGAHLCRHWPFLQNIRLGWKGSPRTTTPAYYRNL